MPKRDLPLDAQSTLVSRVFKGSIYVAISKTLDALVAIIFTIVIARALGAGSYGLVGATMGVAYIIGLLSYSGIPEATTKRVAENLAKRDHLSFGATIRSSITLQAILGILLSLACFALAEPLAHTVFGKDQLILPLRIASLMILFRALSSSFHGILQGLQKIGSSAVSNIFDFVIRLVSSIALVYAGFGVPGALAGFALGSLAGLFAVSLAYVTRRKEIPMRSDAEPPRGSLSQVRPLIRLGAPIAASAATVLIFTWADTLALTAFRGTEEVSWYNIAYGMVALLMIVPYSLHTAILPVISNFHSKDDTEGIRTGFEVSVKMTTYLLYFVVAGLVVLGPQIILLLYGEEFTQAAAPLLVLAAWALFRPWGVLSETVALGIGRPEISMKANTLTAFLCVLLNLLLVPQYGFMGAAFASTISILIGTGVLFGLVSRRVASRFPRRAFLSSSVAAFISGSGMFVMMRFFLWYGFSTSVPGLIVSIGLALLTGLLVYLLILSLLGGIDDRDMSFVRRLGIPFGGKVVSLLRKVGGI